MVLRITVYDDAGEPFEVIPSIAEDLIVNRGWTISPDKGKPVFKDVPEVVQDTSAPAETVVESPGPVSRRRTRAPLIEDSEDA